MASTRRVSSNTAAGENGDTAPPSAVPPRFATQAPQLAAETKNRTALFLALDHLRGQLATILTVATSASENSVDANDGVTSPLLDAELEVFFSAALAPAIQARETALVNVMHECFQSELLAKHEVARAQSQHIDTLMRQQRTYERDVAHWKSKLDRRIAENNELRKDFYKQLILLRDLVNKQKNDPKTLKVLDDVLATMSMGKDKAAEFKSLGAGGAHLSASYKHSSGGEGGGGSTSVHREKEKWEERARESMYVDPLSPQCIYSYLKYVGIINLLFIIPSLGSSASSFRNRCSSSNSRMKSSARVTSMAGSHTHAAD